MNSRTPNHRRPQVRPRDRLDTSDGDLGSPLPGVVTECPVGSDAEVPKGRARLAVTLRAVGALLFVVGMAMLVGFGAYRYALESPRFALRRITIEGASRSSHAELVERAKLRLGENLIALDTRAAERRLLADPWALGVKIERRLPATLAISLIEHEAGALALLGGQLLVVDRAGVPFMLHRPPDKLDLPVITGACLNLDCPREILEARIRDGMQVIRHYERTNLARQLPIEEVHIEPGGEITISVGRLGTRLHLGAGPWAKKLAMAERVLGRLRGKKSELAEAVFLDNQTHPERVVVRLR